MLVLFRPIVGRVILINISYADGVTNPYLLLMYCSIEIIAIL